MAKFAIRSKPEYFQKLFEEIRKKRGHVLEAFDPDHVLALLPPDTKLQFGEVLGPAEEIASTNSRREPSFGKAVEAGRNADGRIEVFFLGKDDLVYHKWQLGPNGNWSGANLLGPLMPSKATNLVPGKNADGRIEVFYLGIEDRVIYHNWQLRPNGYWICEYFLGPVNPANAKQIALGYNADGRMELFYVGLDDVLYHNWQLVPNGKWSGEHPLGPAEPRKAKQVAAGQSADGRIEVFYVGLDDGLYHNWQQAPNHQWSGEFPLGSQGLCKAKQVVAAKNADGRIEIFYAGLEDNVLYHNWQVEPNGKWNGACPVDPERLSKAKQIAVGNNADGRLEILYVGLDDVLYHNRQLGANNHWSGESFVGPKEPVKAKHVSVGQNADGRLEVFYVGLDDVLYHNWQIAPNGDWIGQKHLLAIRLFFSFPTIHINNRRIHVARRIRG